MTIIKEDNYGHWQQWDLHWQRNFYTRKCSKSGNYKEYWGAFLEAVRNTKYDLSPCRILEVGAGRGSFAMWLHKEHFDVTCLDRAPTALRLFERHYQRELTKPKYLIGDIRQMPFEDNAFDLVISVGLFEHFQNAMPAVRECDRVCKGMNWHLVVEKKHGAIRRYDVDAPNGINVEPHRGMAEIWSWQKKLQLS